MAASDIVKGRNATISGYLWNTVADHIQLCSEYSECPKASGGICRNRFELFEKKISAKGVEERHHFCQQQFFESEALINESDLYELNWGLTNFDNIVYAFLTIF